MTNIKMLMTVGLLAASTVGCSKITDSQLPDGAEGPAIYNNRQGATRITQATYHELSRTVTNYILWSGLLTDELHTVYDDGGNVSKDRRSGRPIQEPPHIVRSLARVARGVISKYVEGETSAWRSKLFMYEAYAEILIADGWCSGVPLSTLDFEADWTYKPGSTTDEIYEHAIQLLDSAYDLAADSAHLQSSIRVLKARALTALGRYSDASQTVQDVDDGFRYDMRIAFDAGANRDFTHPRYILFTSAVSISDNEGSNGLPYRSSSDVRTKFVPLINDQGTSSFFPLKYITSEDSSTFTLTSGVEVKLILAEAALHNNNAPQMLTILNALRTSGSYTVDTTEIEGGGERIDTVWHAGSGGVAGLRPFTQLPPTLEARLKLLFSERAAWLFLTGSRQGDLRRLVRKYGLQSEQVYPTGVYNIAGAMGVYGTDISFSLHPDEFRNPLFKGCNYDD